jgi:hypothetical protein
MIDLSSSFIFFKRSKYNELKSAIERFPQKRVS